MSSGVPDHAPAAVDLAAVLRPDDHVVVAQGVSEPLGLVAALREQAAALPDVRVFVGLSLSGLVDLDLARAVRLTSYGAMGPLAAADAEGLLDVVPCNYSDLPGLMRDGDLAADVVMLQVTPPDADGMCGTGLSMDFSVDALDSARVVLAEVNDRMPDHPDALRIPYDRITAPSHVSRPLIATASPDPSEVDRGIARWVAALVPDGAALQLGYGATVNAIGSLLTERRGLRVHSALVGDWLLELAESGALADADGPRPVVSAGAVMGSQELYDFVATDPRVRLRRIEQLQSPAALAAVPGLVAVNGAVQVDLGGQVNVEVVGGRRISALGGHTDFLRGAQASPGGRGIVVLPSTAGRSRVSRIVERLESGWVSTQQSMVDTVVTEHGVADLRGAGLARRRAALAAIADPPYRDQLAGSAATDPRPMEVSR